MLHVPQRTSNQPNLRDLLSLILQPYPSPAAITQLVDLCYKIAVALLRMKLGAGTFHPSRFGLSLEDFAYDSIADLYRQDQRGYLMTFASYFGVLEARATEGEILVDLRRLIASAVNQRIVLAYRENDPSLAKLIRNIKLGLRNHSNAKLSEHQNDKVIVPRGAELSTFLLPEISQDLLEIEFRHRVPSNSGLKEMIAVLAKILAEQVEYRKAYTVVGFALLIRSYFASTPASTAASTPTSTIEQDGSHLTEDDFKALIDQAVMEVRDDTGNKYVRSGKMALEMSDKYFRAVVDILQSEFSLDDGERRSYLDILKTHLPGVTESDYRAQHRHILEYLVKLTRERLLDEARKEL